MYCIDGWPYGDMPGYCAETAWVRPGYGIEGPEYCAELAEKCGELLEYCGGLPGYCIELPEYCAGLLADATGYGREPKEPICC
jgi:hypothetical protein